MSFATDAWIVDGVRTPFGRYRGALAGVRADDLGALPIKALQERNRLCGSSLDAVGLGARSILADDAAEPERRGDRDRSPVGWLRRSPGDYRTESARAYRRALCALHHVHRCRPRHRLGD